MGNDKRKMSQTIVRDIISKIESGEFSLHSKLPPEMTLAQNYGVARSTVREALSVLKSLGIISSQQGGGHYVEEADLKFLINSMELESEEYQEIKHLFELRMILEKQAAYIAAERRTEEDLKELRKVLKEFKDALSSSDRTGRDEDFKFHRAMIRATHNPVMIKVMDDLSDMYQRALNVTLKQNIGLVQKRQKVYEEHEAIFLAIEEGKPELARVQCQIHLENVLKKINYILNTIF